MCGFEFEKACSFLTNRWLNWVRVALEFLPNLWYLPFFFLVVRISSRNLRPKKRKLLNPTSTGGEKNELES